MASDFITIVSVFPLAIDERKPGLLPGLFHINPAKEDDFEILHVGDSYYWIHFTEEEREPLKVLTPAKEVAKSVINDFLHNIPGYDEATNSMPGLFAVSGKVEKDYIKKACADELKAARTRQFNWYKVLVAQGDDSYVRANRQHRAVSSLQRIACKALGLERDWLVEVNTEIGPKYCIACKSKVHAEAIVCPNCSCILDEAKYKLIRFANSSSVPTAK
jgi:hypothetical protein